MSIIRRRTTPRRARPRHATGLTDLDLLATAGDRLSSCDDPQAASAILSAFAADLLGGAAAGFYVDQRGRWVEFGRYGLRSVVVDPVVFHDRLTDAARSGAIISGPPVIVPVADACCTLGVLAVTAPRRHLDDAATSALRALSSHAAEAFFRVGVRAPIFTEPHDPVTMVFEPVALPTVLATLSERDAVFVVRPTRDLDDPQDRVRLGAELAGSLRPLRDLVVDADDGTFVVVIRAAATAVSDVASRLLRATQRPDGSQAIVIGAAVHGDGAAPIDTLRDATAAAPAPGRGRPIPRLDTRASEPRTC